MTAGFATVGSSGGQVIGTFTTGQISVFRTAAMGEAKGYKSWIFSTGGGATVTTITIYGTIDPAVLNKDGSINTTYPNPLITNGYWFVLEAPSIAAGTNVVNPMTVGNGTQYLQFTGPLVAVACGSGGTQTGTSTVWGFASP